MTVNAFELAARSVNMCLVNGENPNRAESESIVATVLYSFLDTVSPGDSPQIVRAGLKHCTADENPDLVAYRSFESMIRAILLQGGRDA